MRQCERINAPEVQKAPEISRGRFASLCASAKPESFADADHQRR
jgi:hypothetical protein